MCWKVLWFTGLSGSGKTPIAKGLSTELKKCGNKVNRNGKLLPILAT